jgi:hypothetical protein
METRWITILRSKSWKAKMKMGSEMKHLYYQYSLQLTLVGTPLLEVLPAYLLTK